ncbi:hypothetical protein QVD17_04249 [Tagetes erecta]|uniref:Uncharacterized protein n=1 Tax=Tagetes erecta TaxID=13708 RepID=A0AAD8L9T7_TARER|nr:hypothetical protein QVD17_04249 [Tagetes erecta]
MAARTFPEIPTPSSLLSAYASMSTSIMLFRTMFNQLFPPQLRRCRRSFSLITKSVKDTYINIKFAESEEIGDSFEGVPVTWRYVRQQPQKRTGDRDGFDYANGKPSSGGGFSPERKFIELKFVNHNQFGEE